MVLASLSLICAIGLIATSAWLISRAWQQPPILYLSVAVVSVRAFGLGRGVFRYVERLVSHSAALRGSRTSGFGSWSGWLLLRKRACAEFGEATRSGGWSTMSMPALSLGYGQSCRLQQR